MTSIIPPDALVPVVGLGTTANSTDAFEAFFNELSPETTSGIAFVLLQNRDAEQTPLPDTIARCSPWPVFQAMDNTVVHPNVVYVVPPNCEITLERNNLRLSSPSRPADQRRPIDRFFRSLADARQENAIAILLAGNGEDGTRGIRTIKEHGGMVMIQSPDTAIQNRALHKALISGLADFVLPLEKMAERIIAYVNHSLPALFKANDDSSSEDAGRLKAILSQLRTRTGHDFSGYKRGTVYRRIGRRMAICQTETISEYAAHLTQTPAETEALFHDLLIGITSFFRDPHTFAALEETAIPSLLNNLSDGATVRVWVPGCATGEEAYSLAMLFADYMKHVDKAFHVQIFATDINRKAIAHARAGRYSDAIAEDISSERLATYFSRQGDRSFRVVKEIRDMLIFSEQNLTKDPPFTRMDMVSCRNLLIYLDNALQKEIIPLFHYALNPGGILFLGTSEGIGLSRTLFSPIDKKAKIYRCHKAHTRPHRSIETTASILHRKGASSAPPSVGKNAVHPLSLREIAEQTLLQRSPTAAALVNASGDILYLHGRTGEYLEPSPGDASISNILKMSRQGLKPELTGALRQAVISSESILRDNVRVKTNGDYTGIHLEVHPVTHSASSTPHLPMFLVVLKPAERNGNAVAATVSLTDNHSSTATTEECIAALQKELDVREEYLQAATEELETSNEELRSSNEELQSINEELQSSNEALETSKESLTTLNDELQHHVDALTLANDDMDNFLAGSGVATLFVDSALRVIRFTPEVTRIIALIDGDIGRPLEDITTHLTVAFETLLADIHHVLDTLSTQERELSTRDHEWYLLRIMPYRTRDGRVNGAVLTFFNITARKRAHRDLKNSEERFRSIVEESPTSMHFYELTPDGQLIFTGANPTADQVLGVVHAKLIGKSIETAFPSLVGTHIPDMYCKVARREIPHQSFETPYSDNRFSGVFSVYVFSTLKNQIATHFMDITHLKRTEETLRENARLLTIAGRTARFGGWSATADGQQVTWSDEVALIHGKEPGYSPTVDEALGFYLPQWRQRMKECFAACASDGVPFDEEMEIINADGHHLWVRSTGEAHRDDQGCIVRVEGSFQDITDQKHAEKGQTVFRNALDNATDAIGMATPDGKHYYQNAAFDGLFGTISEYPPDSLYVDKQLGDTVFDTIKNGKRWFGETKMFGREHEILDILVRAYPSTDEGGNIVSLVGIHTDITARKREQREKDSLIHQVNQMQKLESIGTLAGGIAHDFNNLLGGIYGFLDLAGCTDDTTKKNRYLRLASETINRARGLTGQLLTFSKGGAPLKKREHLTSFIEQTATFALSGSSVSCKFEISKDLWICEFDKNQIGQVIDNLVINAVHAMPDGGKLIIAAQNSHLSQNEHTSLDEGDYVKISICDQGTGIAEENLSRIFDPFFTTKPHGHGLGLSTCYSIIHRHGGIIHVVSRPGDGSTFTVYLPALPGVLATAPLPPPMPHRGKGVFVVMDDEQIIRQTAKTILESFGYTVATTRNGSEAIDYFRRNKQQIVAMLFDLTIPGGVGGRDAIDNIRSMCSDTPVFVCSGYADDPVMAAPEEHGFTGSIAKPFVKSELATLLNRHMPMQTPDNDD